ncbi:hypothetical protein CkaCkLH20_07276 [Colletotrichum karsti]|uniref:Uncharacterized protein n=1 Tax=Colletotrichum karsti TaxID=1095194 RepID=A0A9P6I5J2_9PEZI|nr:uncharacterized protein CkaCkLH20_07276 [Colletotrichum karsti]KAF9875456.1 hypothetical protein CkaCkLH20_07276 [Colletotrichum karsti]
MSSTTDTTTSPEPPTDEERAEANRTWHALIAAARDMFGHDESTPQHFGFDRVLAVSDMRNLVALYRTVTTDWGIGTGQLRSMRIAQGKPQIAAYINAVYKLRGGSADDDALRQWFDRSQFI